MDHDGLDVDPDPGQLEGTLLKCPSCRLKFPFSAERHGFARRTLPPARAAVTEHRQVMSTHCPQCGGWVTVA